MRILTVAIVFASSGANTIDAPFSLGTPLRTLFLGGSMSAMTGQHKHRRPGRRAQETPPAASDRQSSSQDVKLVMIHEHPLSGDLGRDILARMPILKIGKLFPILETPTPSDSF